MAQKYEIVIPVEVTDSGYDGVYRTLTLVQDALSAIRGSQLDELDVVMRTPEYRRSDEQSVIEYGERIMQRRYHDDVRGVADEFRQMARDGDFADEDEATTWLHETIDSHRRVIITALAQECLALSKNDDAYIDEHGSLEGAASESGINWSVLAYYTFEVDIKEQLDAYDVDPSDSDTWAEDDDEE